MKLLRLAISRFVHYISQNRLIFSLYFIGSIVCVIMFAFCYGNLVTIKRIENSDQNIYRKYEIKLSKAQMLDLKILEDLKEYTPEEVSFHSELGFNFWGDEIDPDELKEIQEMGGVPDRIAAFLVKNLALFAEYGRVEFSDTELESGEKVVILPSGKFLGEVDDSIVINDETYRIIGMHTLEDFIIPAQCYFDQGFETKAITIVLPSQLNIMENNHFISLLYSLFPESSIKDPSEYYLMAENSFAGELIMVSMMYLLAFLSFAFLIKYIMDTGRYEAIIYSIVGASPGKTIGLVFLGNLLLSIISATIGIAIHMGLYNIIFNKLNLIDNLVYRFKDYALILIFTVVVSAIILIPFCIDYYKKSLYSLKNRYD